MEKHDSASILDPIQPDSLEESVFDHNPPPTSQEFWRGVLAVAPILVGVLPFGLVLGTQAAQKGLSFAEVAMMCGLNFAGGSEFVAIELWKNPPALLLIVGMTFLVNSRHLLMGAILEPYLRNVRARKALLILFFMADEIWAFGLQDARTQRRVNLNLSFYAGVAAALYLTWVASTTIGALIGLRLGNPDALGIDLAFPAVFLVLLKGLWKGYKAAIPWLVSLAVAIVLRLSISGSWYVAGGTVSGLLVTYLLSGQKGQKEC